MTDEPKLSVKDFAAKIKAKYPDYKDIPDEELAQKIIAKYPDYSSQVDLKKKEKIGSQNIPTGQETTAPPSSVTSQDNSTVPQSDLQGNKIKDPLVEKVKLQIERRRQLLETGKSDIPEEETFAEKVKKIPVKKTGENVKVFPSGHFTERKYEVDGEKITRAEFKEKLFEPEFVERLQAGTVQMNYPQDDEIHNLIARQANAGTRLGDKWDYLKSGLYDVAAGAAGAEGYVKDVVREVTGLDVPYTMNEITTTLLAKDLKHKAAEEIERTRQYEDGFIGAISQGDFIGASDQAFNTVVQSAPISIAAAVSGGGATGLGVLSGIMASSEYAGSDKYETLSKGEKLLRSSLYGAAEGFGEGITGKILTKNFKLFKEGLQSQLKLAAQTGGAEAAQATAKELAQKTSGELLKEYGIDMLKEGGSEGATELVQMMTDDFMGIQNYELADYVNQISESMALGTFGGAVMGLPTATRGAIKFADERIKKTQGEDLKQKVDARVEQGTLTPEQGEAIKINIDTRVEAVNSVPENQVTNTDVVDLVQEKQKLEAEKQPLDKVFQEPINEKIEKIDEEIKKKSGIPTEEKTEKIEAKTEELSGTAYHGVTGDSKNSNRIYLADEALATEYGSGEIEQYNYTLKKPFVVKSDSDFNPIQEIINQYQKENPDAKWHPDITEHINKELEKQGYDGLVIQKEALETEKGYKEIGGSYGDPQVIVFDRKNVSKVQPEKPIIAETVESATKPKTAEAITPKEAGSVGVVDVGGVLKENGFVVSDKGGYDKNGINIAFKKSAVLGVDKHGDPFFVDSPHSTDIVLQEIKVVDEAARGKGDAQKALKDFLDAADKTNSTIYLEPEPIARLKNEKNLTRGQLIKWYEKNGFIKVNEAIWKREPQSLKETPKAETKNVQEEKPSETKGDLTNENKSLSLQDETSGTSDQQNKRGTAQGELGGLDSGGTNTPIESERQAQYVVRESDRIVGDDSVKEISIPEKERSALRTPFPKAIFDDSFSEVKSSDKFHQQISESKKGNKYSASVFVYPKEEYKSSKLFLTKDGKAGVAITKDGDIISVFSYGEGKGRAPQLIINAIKEGGVSLDHYDTFLTDYYSKFGFEPVARVKWSDEFAPSDWNKETYKEFNNGEPDVIAMVYNGGDPNTLYQRVGKFGDVREKLKNTPYVETWEEAKRLQAERVKEIKEKSSEANKLIEEGEPTKKIEEEDTGELTDAELLKEDIEAIMQDGRKIRVYETDPVEIAKSQLKRGGNKPTYEKVLFPEKAKALAAAIEKAVTEPTKENYEAFYKKFVETYESPFTGTEQTRKFWNQLVRNFPELDKGKSEDIKNRFTTPIVKTGGLSLGLPQGFWQRNMKKEGDIPLNVFNKWVGAKNKINAHLKQVEFTRNDFNKALRKVYGKSWLQTPKVKTADLEKINAVLEKLGTENRDAVLAELPDGMRDVVAKMRDQIDALSRELMRSGATSDHLRTTIEDNLGFYMTRSYRLHHDSGWNWKNIPDEIKIKAANVLAKEFPDKTVDQIEGILKSYVNNRDIAWDFVKGSTLGSKDLGITKQRKDIPVEIREFLGEFKDPVYNYATSIAKMANLVEKQKFLEKIKEEGMGKWLFKEREGDYNVTIASEGSKTLEPLNGLYTTKEIAKAFKEFSGENKSPDLLKWYMTINSAVKYSKIILSPKTHARNFASNFLFHVANGRIDFEAGAKTAKETYDYLKKSTDEQFREYHKDLIRRGVIDESVHANELKQNIQESIDYIADFEKYGDHFLKKIAKKSLKVMEKAYMMEDNIHKIYAYEVEKKRYEGVFKKDESLTKEQVEEKAAQEAAKIVRLTMPTYSEVPLFIRNLRKFPMTGTFITFPYEVLRNSYNTVWLARKELRSPETRMIGAKRLAGIMTAATVTAGLSLMTRSMLGLGDDDEKDIRRFLPDWSKNSDLFYVANDGEGKFRFLDMGYSDPYNYVKKPFNAVIKGDRNKDLVDAAVEFVKPFLGEQILSAKIIDLMRNIDDNGRQVYNTEAPSGEKFRAMTNHLLGAFEPGLMTDLERIVKAYNKSVDDYSPTAKDEIIGVTTGQKVQGVDFGKSYMYKSRKTGERLGNAVYIYNKVFYNPTASESDKEDSYKIAEESLQNVISDARKDYLAAINLGVPQKKVDEWTDKIFVGKFRANKAVKDAVKLGYSVRLNKDGKIESINNMTPEDEQILKEAKPSAEDQKAINEAKAEAAKILEEMK